MKILVKAEKAGQVLAQSEFEAKTGDPMKRVGRAFKAFREKHPNVSLFDNDVRLKFEKFE